MTKQHLKRIRVPKTWTIKKKEYTFAPRPNPGAHSMDTSMPLIVVMRDMMGYANTKREVVAALHQSEVLVNQVRVKNPKYAIGVMDTLSFTKLDEHYRMMINSKGNLTLNKTTKERILLRPVKIAGKTTLAKGKTQISFTDGNTLRVDKEEYKVGDTLILEHPNKIKDHLKVEPGSYVYFTKGKQVGRSGKIEDVSKDKIIFKMKDGKKQETSKKYAFVVGKESPLVLLPEE